MRKLNASLLMLSLSAALLSACGGSDEGAIVEEDDPEPSTIAASVTVTAAGDPALNGIYATNGIYLNNVTKVNPFGGERETCRFKFTGPRNATTGRVMGGDIRYVPGANDLFVTFIDINSVEFKMDGSTGATVDRANNEIDFAGAVLTSTQGTGQSITLTGSIPMLPNRPEGC